MSDDEFLEGVRPPARDRALALAVRRVIAEWCGVEPASLRPDQPTVELHQKMKAGWAYGWDETGFLIKLEESLQKDIDMRVDLPPFVGGRFLFWSFDGPANLGAWIGEAVKVLDKDRGT